jgi:predicted GIY-YIG superfamily endonuclease
MARNTYKYHFKKGKKTLYSGITKDLEKRERELKREFGEDGYIKQVGSATTMDAALVWESEQARWGNPTRRGLVRGAAE